MSVQQLKNRVLAVLPNCSGRIYLAGVACLNGSTWSLFLACLPFILEFTSGQKQHDWLGLFASWTGIVCVILVAEGRASNYLFGAVNSAIYLLLSFQASFYGEVLTTVYFFIMQPIGLYTWLSNRVNEQDKEEPSHFEAKKLDWRGWLKYLALTALI